MRRHTLTRCLEPRKDMDKADPSQDPSPVLEFAYRITSELSLRRELWTFPIFRLPQPAVHPAG